MTNEEFLLKFRIAFPELSKAPDERVLYFYELAQNSMSASVWAKQYQEGILNLVAHMLTLKYGLDGNGLPIVAVQQEVTSKSIGKISKGMGSKNSDIYAQHQHRYPKTLPQTNNTLFTLLLIKLAYHLDH